jgi:excisionase family DNA binding protein
MDANAPPIGKLLTTKEAAALLGVSDRFLEADRNGPQRIPFRQVGERAVRYTVADLNEYIERVRTGGTAARPWRRARGGR